MKEISPIPMERYLSLLREKRSGVLLNLESMPGRPEEYLGFGAKLQASDVDRLFLWCEFKVHTASESCKLTDALSETAKHDRVKSFTGGDKSMGRGAVDLRTAVGLELMLATNDYLEIGSPAF